MSTSLRPSHTDITLMPPPGRHPYYIVTPPYSRFSAGIKALHLLCHGLNRLGHNAFVQIVPDLPVGLPATHPDLLTPRLTQDIVDFHYAEKRTPIVVYPEVIEGNPLGAPVVVRYILNFPGLLGGNDVFSDDEILFCYSRVLASAVGCPEQVLFVPASDTNVFHPGRPDQPRSGSCYYAYKYQLQHNGPLFAQTRDSLEITREQSPEQLAEIFRRSERLYCYENTAIALEAALCGCPAIFLPNPHLSAIISTEEVGTEGLAWGDSPEEVERAKATVHRVFDNYRASEALFWTQLNRFVATTQARASETYYTRPLRTPLRKSTGWHRHWDAATAFAEDFHWQRGWCGVSRWIVRALLRRGPIGAWRKLVTLAQRRY